MKKKRYSNSTFMSSVVGLVGFLEIALGSFVMLSGFGLLTTPIETTATSELFDLMGISLGIMVIGSGAVLFFNGALFMALSQSVGFSKQNNVMIKDLLAKQ